LRIIITCQFYKNGQTTHVTDLCTELMRQGHQVLLIMNQLHDPGYSRWLRRAKIPYVTTSDPRKLKGCVERLLPAPQIIHNHSIHTLSTATALRDILNIPSITTVHYLNFKPSRLLDGQDAVILISSEMGKAFEQVKAPKHVVENGVPIPKLPAAKKPWNRRALFLAQKSPEKEVNFRNMTECLLAWGWKVSSAGSWRHEGVEFHGWVNEVGILLKQTDLVIGTGRAVREAMAWSVPAWVLGAYCDGLVTPENVAELEVSNFSGRSSKKPFSPQKAALHLKEPSPRELQTLGAFGRKHAEKHYSIQNMVEKVVEVYGKCVSKCSGDYTT